jgi:hypothetical protein
VSEEGGAELGPFGSLIGLGSSWAWVPFVLLLVGLGLGIAGYDRAAGTSGGTAVYDTLALFVLHYLEPAHGEVGALIQVARFVAAAFDLTIIVGVVLTWWRWALRQHRKDQAGKARDHAVICGLGTIGAAIARALLTSDDPVQVIAIDPDPHNPHADEVRRYGGIVIEGDALSDEVLAGVGLRNAGILVCSTGDDDRNADVLARAEKHVVGNKEPVRGYVSVADLELCHLYRVAHALHPTPTGLVDVDFFNLAENAAHSLVDELPRDPSLRVLIVGDGELGVGIALRLAHDRIRRGDLAETGPRQEITFAGPEATRRLEHLLARWPIVAEGCTVHAVDVDWERGAVTKLADLEKLLGSPPDVAVVCTPDRSTSLMLCELLSEVLFGQLTRIVVAILGADRVRTLFPVGDNVELFDPAQRGATLDLLLHHRTEALGRGLHETYCHTQLSKDDASETSPIAFLTWGQLTPDIKETNRDQARSIIVQLRSQGYDATRIPGSFVPRSVEEFPPAAVEAMAEAEHERWCEQKQRSGSRFGPIRDDNLGVHPDIVPWAQLDASVQDKDREFVRSWPRLLLAAGYHVVRRRPAPPVASEVGHRTSDALPSD